MISICTSSQIIKFRGCENTVQIKYRVKVRNQLIGGFLKKQGYKQICFSQINKENCSNSIQIVQEEQLKLVGQLMGQQDLGIVREMVRKEPRLLSTNKDQLITRLVDMRVHMKRNISILDIIKREPSLLVQQPGLQLDDKQEERDMLQSWMFGVFDDSDEQWEEQYNQLKKYVEAVGDAHVGFRDTDDDQLVRWAKKQRNEYIAGVLRDTRCRKLERVQFEFDDAVAEWLCRYNNLVQFKRKYGKNFEALLASESNMELAAWSTAQRVAYRARVLEEEKAEKLAEIGFDWDGVDALS
eukprot:TRINITY_DN29984_c0_g1_i1.p1 TRINITY_DN29984_c0_g1~~TRINITY_DN29984_c0_g1_i1.p1  ORF type:complete len:297 (-),score=39.75 TRINITY_DN29984_c0_g1_i1:594-1484(-)